MTRRNEIVYYAMLAPAFAVQAWLIFTGVWTALTQSFGYIPAAEMYELTTVYYAAILRDADFVAGFCFSLFTSLVSAVLSVLLGLLLAVLLLRSSYGGLLGEYLYRLPVMVPHIIAVLLVLNTFSSTGIFARLLYKLGIIASETAFPDMTFDKLGLGVVLTYLWKSTPFATLMIYTVLKNINPRLYQVALNLGASRWQTFYHVILPLVRPAMFAAFIFLFAFAFTSFEVPYLIGPTYPKALPVLAYNYYIQPDIEARPYAMAANIIMTILTAGLVFIYSKYAGKARC